MADVSYININGTQYTIDDLQATQELADVRVGADGQTYASAGEAVRAQIEAVNESMTAAQGDITAIYDEIDTVKGDVSTAQGDITTLQGDVSDLQTDVSAIEGNIASEFSTSTTYAIGDYCVYQGTLYRFKNAHTGAWDSDDVESTDIGTMLDDLDEKKANIDGSYASMTVGNAEQLVSTVGIEDSVPYNFRTAGGSADIGDRETDMVVGGTVAWNQFARELDGTYWQSANATASFSNGVVSFTASARYGCVLTKVAHKVPAVNGHKYFLSGKIKPASTSNVRFGMGVSSNFGNTGVAKASITGDGSTFQNIDIIGNFTGDNTANNCVIIMESATGDFAEIQAKDIVLFDLTQMFGSTIADYIYSLEQANAGAGVAWFRKLFPKPYYAYDAGSLQSVNTSAHNMVGFNAWDEEWEVGEIYSSSGRNAPDGSGTQYWRSKNYIRVVPNTTYFAYSPTASNKSLRVRFYDADKNYLGYVDGNNSQVTTGNTFATASNCHYIRFAPEIANIPNHDICINLSWDGEKDGEYEPYELHSYALDSSLTLRGIPKLDSDNKLYYDGDTYEADGTVTRKYGVVDLGTLTWGWNPQYKSYIASNVSNRQKGVGNLITAVFETKAGSWNGADPTENIIWGNGSNETIYIQTTTSYTDAAAFKAAMSGVYLVYELATPTTEEADPYQNPQIVNDFGTEEYVDAGVTAATPTRDVAIPVGHSTFYAANLRAKLEMAPESPEGNGDYIVRQTDGENSYVPLVIPTELPANPSTDGTYSLKVTVSDGTATLSWVADS